MGGRQLQGSRGFGCVRGSENHLYNFLILEPLRIAGVPNLETPQTPPPVAVNPCNVSRKPPDVHHPKTVNHKKQ